VQLEAEHGSLEFAMREKLQQCIKVLKYLGRKELDFQVNREKVKVPLALEHFRDYMVFTILQDGSLKYGGSNDAPRTAAFTAYIKLDNLEPTDDMIDIVISRLAPECRQRAEKIMRERMIDHQLKYDGLEFLVKDKA
jgi:hypothetical protein